MNVRQTLVREILEQRASEYYDDEITTITTEWMDSESQITVYHRFVEQRPLRTWFHCWQYLEEDTIVERLTYVAGERTLTNVKTHTGGFTDITTDVQAEVDQALNVVSTDESTDQARQSESSTDDPRGIGR